LKEGAKTTATGKKKVSTSWGKKEEAARKFFEKGSFVALEGVREGRGGPKKSAERNCQNSDGA